MLTTLYCVTSLFCVSLLNTTSSVIYEKLEEKTKVNYENEENRENTLMFKTLVEYNLGTRLNKTASEVVTNVTNHVLHNITETIKIQPIGHATPSPCLENAVNFMRTEATAVVREMFPCVTIVHDKYSNFTKEIKAGLKGYSKNKLALNKLADTCDARANITDCYVTTLQNIQKSVTKYTTRNEELAIEMNNLMRNEIRNAEICIKNFLPRLNTMGATAIENALKCLKDEVKSR
ncbi:hypothetical protein KM043_018615 [Ampulex compressa]|nr:hypothetical protein KM043_018615 [Ampulex compressa]